MIDTERTRSDFETMILKIAEEKDYQFMYDLMKRFPEHDGYATTWVDMAWIGWCKAIERCLPLDANE